jgi:phosphatidylglycerophosphate synthase
MLSTETLTYGVIRRGYQHHEFPEEVLFDHYAKAVSPLLTPLFVRCKMTPNGVTVVMIVSGALGALLFAIPWMPSRISGAVLIQLWMILDCCDGEVARITRVFSKFGTEMDFLAHAVNHPLFNLSFACSLLVLDRYNCYAVLACALVSISAEMLLRHLAGLAFTYRRLYGEAPFDGSRRSVPKIWATRLLGVFYMYPNFALLFPILYLIDRWAGTSIAPIYFAAQAVFSFLLSARVALRWMRILRSE